MQQLPIKYQERYSDEDPRCHRGFAPHRNDGGEWVYEIQIELEPGRWQGGSALIFRLIECYREKIEEETEGDEVVLRGGGQRTRKLAEEWAYSRPSHGECPTPTPSQALLIDALEAGDVRGHTGERIAGELCRSLFIAQSPAAAKVLPRVVERVLKELVN